jgi:16S rRNA (guanine966-N2)-methyltransferase
LIYNKHSNVTKNIEENHNRAAIVFVHGQEAKMRIITGSARGTRLETLDGEDTRPTPERVKEAIFSMIQFEIEGRRVFDIFAGTGQLGLEALSRGAAAALLCDNRRDATEIIKRNARRTNLYDRCRVMCSDAYTLVRSLSGREQFNIFFVDPPYTDKSIGTIVSSLHRYNLCAPGAVVIAESDQREPLEIEGFEVRRHNRYGRVYITVYDYKGTEEAGEQ